MLRNQRVMMICIALLLALASAGPAMAAPEQPAPLMGVTITVTSTGDDISVNGNCTLREAIQAANTDKKVDKCPAGSGTDTIKLGTHTYKMSLAGAQEDSNKTGDFDIRSSVKIVGTGIGKTIIDLGKIDRAFDVRSTTVTVALQDMTIQNGYTYNGETGDHGGAVANRAAMTITRVQFKGNRVAGDAGEKGGAVFNKAKLTVTGSDFSANVSDSEGGAIGNLGTLVVDNTTFTNNEGLVGGAIFNDTTGTAQLNKNTKFTGNKSGPGNGAAIYNSGKLAAQYNRYEANSGDGAVIEGTGSITVRYSTFLNNTTSSGALYGTAGTLTVSHSLISGNTASFTNYGQVSVNGASVVIDRSTITGATAAGLVVRNGSARAVNSTFSGLRSENCGGAVCVLGGTGVSLESVTITGTKVADGFGAIVTQAGVTKLHNTLVANTFNLAGDQRVPDCASQPGTLTSQGYNLVSNAEGCGWTAATGDKVGTQAAPIDAKLGPLAKNGGPTPTHALASNSPAVNAADPALTVKTDQRMYKRPAGPRPDIGAFEYGAVAP